jgi:hypothetical protein
MNEYELEVYNELVDWKRKMNSRSSLVKRISRKTQAKINELIPEKVHNVITESIKAMVKTTLYGSKLTTKKDQARGQNLQEKDELARKKISIFQKTAMIEGAGTGAGGLLVGLADFPLLLSIKMKFLFEMAAVYGFDTNQMEERVFILYIFQLAFSSDEVRRDTFYKIEHWEETKHEAEELDWRKFQQEYRDYIDLAKLLQLVPGIGAVVGAVANNNLLKHLGETAMNAYRLRIIKTPEH